MSANTALLSELVTYLNRGVAPKYVETGGIRVYNQKCIRGQRVSDEPSRRTQASARLSQVDKELRLFDVLINSTGVGTLGRVGQIFGLDEPATADSHLTIVRPDPQKIDPLFLGYVLKAYEPEIERLGEGSTGQTELSRAKLGELEINLISRDAQKSASAFLYAIDKLISNNRRMNETLEAMARAIFKDWFVDFGPVRAKMEGRTPYLAPEIWDLFPDRLDDEEKPVGWMFGVLSDLCDRVENGGTPSRQESAYWEGGTVPWLSSGEVRQPVVLRTSEMITELGLRNSSAKIWPPGTTVVAMYGATAGEVCLLGDFMSSNQACCGLIPKKWSREYLFITVRSSSNELASKSIGSAQQNLSQKLVSNHETLLTDEKVIKAYSETTSLLLDRWISNEKESITLTATRDFLLPKLISGEIRVRDAEQFINEMVGS